MSEAEFIPMRTIWIALDDAPVHSANQLLAQIGTAGDQKADEIFLTIGNATPPAVLGTAEEQRAALAAMGTVAVRPICRISVTRKRLAEFVAVLQETITRYDSGASLDEQ